MADRNFDLVILSHCLDYTCGAIAWEAVRKKDRNYHTLWGFWTSKIHSFKNKEDIFSYPERMSKKDFNGLSKTKKNILENVGNKQLLAEFGGETNDVGAKFAYKRGKTNK